MFQALVKGRIQENHHFKSLPRKPIVHDLVAIALIAQLVELLGDLTHSLTLEWRRVTLVTIQRGHLGKDCLD